MYTPTTASLAGAAGGGALAMTGLDIGWIIVAAATLILAGTAILRIMPKGQE